MTIFGVKTMYKIGINYATADYIAKKTNTPTLTVLKDLKLNGISTLDVLYDDIKNTNVYSNALCANLSINSCYSLVDISELDNYSSCLEMIDYCALKRINHIMILPKVDKGVQNYLFNVKHNLKKIVNYAKTLGIKISIENYGLNEPFCSIDGVYDVLKSVKGLGLVYDSANFYLSKQDPYLAIQKLLPYVSRVHLKDRGAKIDGDTLAFLDIDGALSSVYPLGEGVCQLDKIIDYLLKNSKIDEFVLEGITDTDMISDTFDSVIYLKTRISEYENKWNSWTFTRRA